MSKRSWMTGRAIHEECSTRMRPHEQGQSSLHPVVCTEAFYPLSIFYPPSFTRSQAGKPQPFHQRRSVGLTDFTPTVAKCAYFTGTPHQLPIPKENSRFPLQPPAKIPHLRTVASLHLTCRPSAKARQSGFITLPAPDRWANTDPIHRACSTRALFTASAALRSKTPFIVRPWLAMESVAHDAAPELLLPARLQVITASQNANS